MLRVLYMELNADNVAWCAKTKWEIADERRDLAISSRR